MSQPNYDIQIWKCFCRMPGATEEWADEMADAGAIAIGWGHVGPLEEYKTAEDLKSAIDECVPKEIRRGGKAALVALRFGMKAGDWVLMPSEASGTLYWGEVIGTEVTFLSGGDRCPFEHRRTVNWFGKYPYRAFLKALGSQIGGQNTLHRVRSVDPVKLDAAFWALGVERRGSLRGRRGKARRPDAEWGRLGELRAKQWLEKNRHREVNDVAHLALGYDLEAEGIAYEVKTRHDPSFPVQLSRNEFRVASKLGKDYHLLVLTAENERDLKHTFPTEYADPVRRLAYKTRYVPEYVFEVD